MAEITTCPKCGAPLPDNAPAGICPKCLMQAGLASELGAGLGVEMEPTTVTSRFVPPETEELAKHFPQLQIIELLGKGGMGAVYKARQPGLDRLVALKILPSEIGIDPAFAERFTREARALAKLGHQNIVSVFDFGQANGLYYFIMEFVDGTNLRQLIETSGLKPEEALAIVPQICEALQFAHNEGIVHRDIKPENILIDKHGRVKIADFGLAKLLASSGRDAPDLTLTAAHQVMGTLHYMAPEQMRGSHAVDHRADIYSLGVVFYEMLTGELPIGQFERPSNKVQIDVRLDEVVLRTLENEPSRRYQKASEVKSDVEQISSGVRSGEFVPASTERLSQDDGIFVESARQQVRGPATGLMIAGCVGPVMAVLGIVATISTQLIGRIELTILLGMAFWESVLGLIIIAGTQRMRRLESYGLAMTSAILAVVPIMGPHYILSLPMGIWALLMLTRPDIKLAFARVQDEAIRVAGDSKSRAKPDQSHTAHDHDAEFVWPYRARIVIGVFLWSIVAALLETASRFAPIFRYFEISLPMSSQFVVSHARQLLPLVLLVALFALGITFLLRSHNKWRYANTWSFFSLLLVPLVTACLSAYMLVSPLLQLIEAL